MQRTSAAWLSWAPRVAGVLVAAFLALFALDAFENQSFLGALPAFAIHLIPSFFVLAAVAISWKLEWVGAVAFFGLAVAYAVMVRGRIDWIAAISGPLVLVGVLFLVAWRRREATHATR